MNTAEFFPDTATVCPLCLAFGAEEVSSGVDATIVQVGAFDMMEVRTRLRELAATDLPTVEAGFRQMAVCSARFFRATPATWPVPWSRLPDGPIRRAGSGSPAVCARLDPDSEEHPTLRCLVPLATAGEEPAWNHRELSRGHRAIPLRSERAVAEAPMIAQLIQQMGLDISTIVRPPGPGLLLDDARRARDVVFVAEAEGSPFVPAQEFVRDYDVRSVMGFGGLVSAGVFCAAILFSRVRITSEVADLFKVIGLNFKLAMLPLQSRPLFKPGRSPDRSPETEVSSVPPPLPRRCSAARRINV